MTIKCCVILVLLFATNACFLISYPRDGIYLIPKGYIGDVIIFFDHPDGVVPETENGIYVYRIPDDGILKVKTKGYTGIVNLSYFYVGKENDRQEIKYLRITGDTDMHGKLKDKFDGQISAQEYESGVFVMNTGGLGSFNTKKGVVQFTSFIVGTPKEVEYLYNKMEHRITAVQKDLMKQ